MVLLPERLPPSIDEERLDSLVHYICAFVDNPSQLGATKLNKILWYSDVLAYLQRGASISHATYKKEKFGPVPKGIMASRNRLAISNRVVVRQAPFFGYAQTQLIALTRPDISMFSSEEIAFVDGVATVIRDEHSAASISLATHDKVWECAEIGEEIPLYAVLGAKLEEVTEDDLEWVNENREALLAQS